jgi:hypothetical protein
MENKIEIKEKQKLGLGRLPEVIDFLKTLNLDIAVHDMENAKQYLLDVGHSLPLVRDGLDGIRASYDKRRDDLSVWFTNGFDNKNNETRIIVEKWISNNFLESDKF